MRHWADYLIFVLVLLISVIIGIYHAATGGRQRTTEEFIMANRQLKVNHVEVIRLPYIYVYICIYMDMYVC